MDMQGISSDDLVTQLMRLLPEVEPYVEKEAERHGLRASQVTHWEQVDVHPGTFLSDVLAYPLFQPLMKAPEINAQQEDFLARCFEFIEALEEDPTGWLVDTAYFTFLEFFLESREVCDRAFRFAWPKTRAATLAMLRGWNVPVDPSWENPPGEDERQG
ncbi:hypothetical protein [Streptomyces scabiei]|uniref:hypothetical protein n=1 Tax=Streptomyces TaxID=1883 RepID=UPI0029AB4481|nr:hypothetical protein [Streptomyces scabiei]MDX3111898.1 hypothetical protein [Streptomyces scabiei]